MGINVILAELGYVVLNWKCPLETSVEVGFVNLCSSLLEFETVIMPTSDVGGFTGLTADIEAGGHNPMFRSLRQPLTCSFIGFITNPRADSFFDPDNAAANSSHFYLFLWSEVAMIYPSKL